MAKQIIQHLGRQGGTILVSGGRFPGGVKSSTGGGRE
jgi:hypothetical protein